MKKSRIAYTWLFALLSFMLLASLAVALARIQCASTVFASDWETENLTNFPADERNFRLSPDGRMLAFVGHHEGKAQVYVMSMQSRETRNVSASLNYDTHNAKWSPDSRYLVFEERHQSSALNHIFAWDSLNDELLTVTNGIYLAGAYGFINEHELLYGIIHGDRHETRLRNLSSGEDRLLNYSIISISPNREWFLLSYGDSDTRLHHITDETEIPLQNSYSNDYYWSPDSQWIAFVEGDYRNSQLRLLNLATQEERLLELSLCYGCQMVWSPDSHYIAWNESSSTWDGNSLQSWSSVIWLYDVENRTSRIIEEIEHPIGYLVWSPVDTNLLMFSTFSGVYIHNISAGITHNFVYGHRVILNSQWSPNGNYVAVLAFGVSQDNRDFWQELLLFDIRDGIVHTVLQGNFDANLWGIGYWNSSRIEWTADNELIFSARREDSTDGYNIMMARPVLASSNQSPQCDLT